MNDAVAEDPVEVFEVIVHAAGRMENTDAFWTEVPALSACMGEGWAVEEVLEDTRRAIEHWITWTRGSTPRIELDPLYAV